MDINTTIIDPMKLQTLFYADDGHLAGNDPVQLQKGLNIFMELFEHMNLCMNMNKTKSKIYFGSSTITHESPEAYA